MKLKPIHYFLGGVALTALVAAARFVGGTPLSYLDATRPTAVTLLGHTYVVWRDPTAQRWRLMEDRCPHRYVAVT